MKRFLLLLYVANLLTSPIFSKSVSHPPYFSVLSSIGALSTIGGGAPIHTTPTTWIILEGMIPINHPKIYLYTQLRFAFPLNTAGFPLSAILPIMNMENIRMGALLGFGGILKDWRNEEDKGWNISMNTGFIVEGKIYNANMIPNYKNSSLNDTIRSSINIGFNINMRFRYNISKYNGITLGLNLEYLNGIYAGDSFYIEKQLLSSSVHMLGYNITVGLHF